MQELKIVFSRYAPVANLEQIKVECSAVILKTKPVPACVVNCKPKLSIMYPRIFPDYELSESGVDISTR